jgi:hypothetical protein
MEGADIRKLDRGTEKVVLAHYCTVGDPAYIEKLLREETMYGVYAGDTLAGFAGFHPEGSIGLMEIFPEFRRRGYGAALQRDLANLMLTGDTSPSARFSRTTGNPWPCSGSWDFRSPRRGCTGYFNSKKPLGFFEEKIAGRALAASLPERCPFRRACRRKGLILFYCVKTH